MPIVFKKPVTKIGERVLDPKDPMFLRKQQGYKWAIELEHPELEWWQAETIHFALETGKDHYHSHYFDRYGQVACPAGDSEGPCMCRFGLGLFFSPGLGKTATFLIYDQLVRKFLREQQDKRADWPSLVWTTTTAKWQWASIEIPKWRPDLTPAGKVMVIDGDPGTRDLQMKLLVEIKPEIVLIHHAQIGTSVEGVFDFLQGIHFLLLGSDEDQYFKNWSSQRTLRKNAIQRCAEVALSGTPESGYPDKLHAVLHGIAPGKYVEKEVVPCTPGKLCPLPSYTRRTYEKSCKGCFNYLPQSNRCKVGGHEPTEDDLGIKYHYLTSGAFGNFRDFKNTYCQLSGSSVVGSQNEDYLHDLIYSQGYAYRITSKDVGRDGEVIITKIGLEMTPEQKQLYSVIANGLRQYFDEKFEEVEERGSTFILAMMTHLRRVTTLSPWAFKMRYGDHPIPVIKTLPDIFNSSISSKSEWAIQFVTDNVLDSDNKMIIGSEWDDCLSELKVRLEKLGITEAPVNIEAGNNDREFNVSMPDGTQSYYAVINGGVEKKHRTAIQMAFNGDPRLKVLLMTQAGYEAINLTGGLEKGQTMFITCLGVPWLPDKLTQLYGRADRMDMKGSILVLLPACVGTIDELVHGVLYAKSLAAERIIDGNFEDDAVAAQMSLHDITFLKRLIGKV